MSTYEMLRKSALKAKETKDAKRDVQMVEQNERWPAQPRHPLQPSVRHDLIPWGTRIRKEDQALLDQRKAMLGSRDPVERMAAVMADHVLTSPHEIRRLLPNVTTDPTKKQGNSIQAWHSIADEAGRVVRTHIEHGHASRMGPELDHEIRRGSIRLDVTGGLYDTPVKPYAEQLNDNTRQVAIQVRRSLTIGTRAEQDLTNEAAILSRDIPQSRAKMASAAEFGIDPTTPMPHRHEPVTMGALRAHLAIEAGAARAGHLPANRVVARAMDFAAIAGRSGDDSEYEAMPYIRPNYAAAQRRGPEETIEAIKNHMTSPREPIPAVNRAKMDDPVMQAASADLLRRDAQRPVTKAVGHTYTALEHARAQNQRR